MMTKFEVEKAKRSRGHNMAREVRMRIARTVRTRTKGTRTRRAERHGEYIEIGRSG